MKWNDGDIAFAMNSTSVYYRETNDFLNFAAEISMDRHLVTASGMFGSENSDTKLNSDCEFNNH
jgi:hypothetical protein